MTFRAGRLLAMPLLLVALIVGIPGTICIPQVATGVFVEKPYLQLGDATKTADPESMVVMWHAAPEEAAWAVEWRQSGTTTWTRAAGIDSRLIVVQGIPPHRIFRATLKGLKPGAEFEYRVLRDGAPVFEAHGIARKAVGQPYRFVVFGDCAENTPGQKAIAFQTYRLHPDFVFIPGDIVYTHGAISEYRKEYFPIYNADEPSSSAGAPLLRSTLFLAVPGNHDVEGGDLGAWPDGLAYFYLWDQPLNGPAAPLGARFAAPYQGPDANKRAFLAAAMPNYPRMASYSFDYGNSHWTVLDSNPYADWSKPPLRTWLEHDLASAKSATWRFVTFHHPGFSTAERLVDPIRMALFGNIFEQGNVDIVFNGHVHTYFRSHPLRFGPVSSGIPSVDTVYDGRAHTRPDGILYIVTGAGGAHLHHITARQQMVIGFLTSRFVPNVHCLTVADVYGKTLTVRQIDTEGKEVDRYVVTK